MLALGWRARRTRWTMVDRGWAIRRDKGVGIGRRHRIAEEMAMTPFLHGLDCVEVARGDYVAISSERFRRQCRSN
jgi:hypothetical protein